MRWCGERGGPTSLSAVRSKVTWPRCTKRSGWWPWWALPCWRPDCSADTGSRGGRSGRSRRSAPTAAEISLSNLSRRIDVTGTETELTGLARTLNQMFDRIESAFAQQVRFTADASHELRTPVAVILSHSELALDKQRPAEELRETIETCRRSALRMRSLIESLLTLARFDSGEVTLDSRPFDLARTVGDCVALVRPLAAQRRITIQADSRPRPPRRATRTGLPKSSRIS